MMDIIRPRVNKSSMLLYPNTFVDIDTPEKAYWLGFLAADGSVRRNRVSLNLKTSDAGHIAKFQAFIGSTHKPYVLDGGFAGCTTTRVDISSRAMAWDLNSHGITPNKTHFLLPPSIKPNLIRHYIRGFWDGDGSIGIYGNWSQVHASVSCCSLELIDWIRESLPYPAAYNIEKNGMHRIRSVSQNAIGNLNYMYEDATVYLDRKYKLFIKAIA